MSGEEVIKIFSDTGALLEGHFIYTSGRHGEQFLQAARVLQYPGHTSKLCAALAEPFVDDSIQLVVGPATGGIILAYETARHLKCRAVFTEKDGESGQALKRGFALEPGTHTLVVEDVVTTGGSVAKTVAHMQARGAEVVAVAVLIDRSGGSAHFDCAYRPLAELDMKSWTPEECPLCAQNVPLIEPDDIVL